jgi:CRP-like cAMP-binding protein
MATKLHPACTLFEKAVHNNSLLKRILESEPPQFNGTWCDALGGRITRWEKGYHFPLRSMVIVLKGYVTLYGTGDGKWKRLLELYGAGDIIPYWDLDDTLLMVDAEASVVRVDQSQIAMLLGEHNRYAMELVNTQLRQHIQRRNLTNPKLCADEKVALARQMLADDYGDWQSVPKATIASMLDMRPETLSRSLKALEAA